jgi:hypothetical protein
MERCVGVVSRGIRTPIIRKGDDLTSIVVDSIEKVVKSENLTLKETDIVGVTEAVVAKSQSNYATLDDLKTDIENKYPDGELGIIFPIFSRNRFSIVLKGIAKGVKKLYLQLNYPNDEVGNPIANVDKLYERGINPYVDEFTENEFTEIFNKEDRINPFTGVDILEYYKNLSNNIEVIFSNNPVSILKYTKNVLVADIHGRKRTKEIMKNAGAKIVYGLDEILNAPINGSRIQPRIWRSWFKLIK